MRCARLEDGLDSVLSAREAPFSFPYEVVVVSASMAAAASAASASIADAAHAAARASSSCGSEG